MAHLKNFESYGEGEKTVYRKKSLTCFVGLDITMAVSIASIFREQNRWSIGFSKLFGST